MKFLRAFGTTVLVALAFVAAALAADRAIHAAQVDDLLVSALFLWVFATPLVALAGRVGGGATATTMGLRSRHVGRRLLGGSLLGFATLLGPFAIGASLGAYSFVGVDEPAAALYAIPLLGALAFGEEFLYRGVLFRTWEQALPARIAVLLQAVAFAAVHASNPDASPLGLVGVTLAGVLLGALAQTTRSLWVPVGFHAAWNVCECVIVGLPVSGFETPALLRFRPHGDGFAPWWGGGFGPEEGLAYHLALTVATALVLVSSGVSDPKPAAR